MRSPSVGAEVRVRGRAGGDEDDLAVEVVRLALDGHDVDAVDVVDLVVQQRAAPVDEVDPGGGELLGDVGRLLRGQAADARVDGLGVDGRVDRADAHLGGLVDLGQDVGGGDEGLGGDAVGEHARPSGAHGFDEGDFGAQLRGDQCRLVAGRTAADDRYSCHGSPFDVGML
ncbi:hypothetical protein GCM10029992_04390 [Glycomyces albus]